MSELENIINNLQNLNLTPSSDPSVPNNLRNFRENNLILNVKMSLKPEYRRLNRKMS